MLVKRKIHLVIKLLVMVITFSMVACRGGSSKIPDGFGEIVFSNDDVVFHRIDNHTWVGSGNLTYNESLYLVEGNDRAILLDVGTMITDLNNIVTSITSKPVTLIATHVHPDHTGSAVNYYPEIWISPGDTVLVPWIMENYNGDINFLKDGEIIELGGRQLEVAFTPGHTPGLITLIDTNAGYGFSGDSFGSGSLILGVDFSTLIATCYKMGEVMQKKNVKYLYPGHFDGTNVETSKRIEDIIKLSSYVMSGKVEGKPNQYGGLVVNDYGMSIVYYEQQIK